MLRSLKRLAFALGLLAAGVGLAGSPVAQAKGVLGLGFGPGVGPDLNPLPSTGELLHQLTGGLFGALLSALTPGFLRNADIHTLQWLVALPNAADTGLWPTVGRLEQDMVWVAGALLPLTLTIAAARDSALALALRAHPGAALLRFLGAALSLVLYRFAVKSGVALTNTLTDTMLSWPVVAEGLHRTVLVLFAGALLSGSGGALLGLLGLLALGLALALLLLKVVILMVLAILFVAGPLFIALGQLPGLGHLTSGWLLALASVCIVPVGWCVIFATAGAIGLDVTNLGAGAHIDSRVLGALAALATFYLAYRWPLMVIGHVRGALGGLGARPGTTAGGRGGGPVSDRVLAARANRAKTSLQQTVLGAGHGLGAVAGRLGAPRGGLLGAGARSALGPAAPLLGAALAGAMPRTQPARKTRGKGTSRGKRPRQTPSAARAGEGTAATPAAAAAGRRERRGPVRRPASSTPTSGAGAPPGTPPRATAVGAQPAPPAATLSCGAPRTPGASAASVPARAARRPRATSAAGQPPAAAVVRTHLAASEKAPAVVSVVHRAPASAGGSSATSSTAGGDRPARMPGGAPPPLRPSPPSPAPPAPPASQVRPAPPAPAARPRKALSRRSTQTRTGGAGKHGTDGGSGR